MEKATSKPKKVNTVLIKTKTDVQGTLLSLPIGKPTSIKNSLIKACSIRSAVRKLKDAGFSFNITEKGRVDDVIVTRTK